MVFEVANGATQLVVFAILPQLIDAGVCDAVTKQRLINARDNALIYQEQI